MEVTEGGMVMLPLIPLHPLKQYSPIVLTDDGKEMEINPLQSWKAEFPIDTIVEGSVTDVNPVQL